MDEKNGKQTPLADDLAPLHDKIEYCESHGLSILTPEARMLIYLVENKSACMKELMLASRISYRGFYLAYDRLLASGFIKASTDANDRRVRRVELKGVPC